MWAWFSTLSRGLTRHPFNGCCDSFYSCSFLLQGDGKMATVGNKVIILESWSWTGKPVMVIQSREGRTEIIDKITYTD